MQAVQSSKFWAKNWTNEHVIARGHQTVAQLRRLGVVVIINDHVNAAKALNASGVHLGQEDDSPSMARDVLGANYIIGLSTHSFDQASTAIQKGVDYIGFGPIFGTHTKVNPGRPVGLDMLADAVRTTPLPVIAIGGIQAQHLPGIRKTGAHGWAVASALARNGSLSENVRNLS